MGVEMGSVIVGVIGTLMGVLVGGAIQQLQASRNRHWQQQDSLNNTKRGVYAEYLRSISASYAQAMSGRRSRSEDANLYAAAAEIEVLSGEEVSGPARSLVEAVIEVHSGIAEGTGVAEAVVDDVDRRRHRVIDLFKADLGLKTHPQRGRSRWWRK
jgi:transcription initiation factor TFIIIB Brf1 subunit/transcription initiation factor TFIIB